MCVGTILSSAHEGACLVNHVSTSHFCRRLVCSSASEQLSEVLLAILSLHLLAIKKLPGLDAVVGGCQARGVALLRQAQIHIFVTLELQESLQSREEGKALATGLE